ncbi:MAG: M56 family metallopeptidase [Planctomycetales bacterium]
MNGSLILQQLERWSARWSDWMWSMSWQVGLLVALVTALTWLGRRRSAIWLHAVWLLVLVRLVLPPDLALPTGWGWWVRAPQTISQSDRPAPPTARSDTSLSSQSDAQTAELVNPPTKAAARQVATGGERASASVAESDSTVSQERRSPGLTWAAGLMLAWAGVSATLLGLLLVGTLRVWKWVHDAEPIDDAPLYRLLTGCLRQLGINRSVELRNSEACSTPVVVGLSRTVILLPKSLVAELSSEQLRAVLLHELQHVVRGDALINLAQAILGALYFFHPLVWWANRRLRELREEACDELTVAALQGERKAYGEALVKVTEMFGYDAPPLALGVMESRHPAHRRLGRILDPHLPQVGRLGWKGMLAMVGLGLVLLPAAAAKVPSKENASNARVPVTEPSSSDVEPAGEAPVGAAAKADARSSPVEVALHDDDPEALFGTGPAEPRAAEAVQPPLADDAPAERWRYRWGDHLRFAYEVRIEANLGDETEVLSGTPICQVHSTGKGGLELTLQGRLSSIRKSHGARGFPGRPPHIPNPFASTPFAGVGGSPFAADNSLEVDDRGTVQKVRGESQLPYLLGNLSQLPILHFPEHTGDAWELTERSAITLFEGDEGFPPRPRFGPFAAQGVKERLDAQDHSTIRLGTAKSGALVVTRTHALRTEQQAAVLPRMELTGQTEWTLDRERGLARSITGKLLLVHNTASASHRIPLQLSLRLLDAGELADLDRQQPPATVPGTAPAANSAGGFGLPEE